MLGLKIRFNFLQLSISKAPSLYPSHCAVIGPQHIYLRMGRTILLLLVVLDDVTSLSPSAIIWQDVFERIMALTLHFLATVVMACKRSSSHYIATRWDIVGSNSVLFQNISIMHNGTGFGHAETVVVSNGVCTLRASSCVEQFVMEDSAYCTHRLLGLTSLHSNSSRPPVSLHSSPPSLTHSSHLLFKHLSHSLEQTPS